MTELLSHPHLIRLANKDDVGAIQEIFNHAIIHTTAVYSYKPYTAEEMDQWFKAKIQDKLPVFVSTINDVITGFVTYGKFREQPTYKYCAEHSIYVSPDFRRQGIARILMKKIIATAQENDLHSLIGGIDASNQVSLHFHREFGFEEVGLIKQVGYKFDKWLDLSFMQLIFDSSKNPTAD